MKGKNNKFIFLHSEKHKNEDMYAKLKIDKIVTEKGSTRGAVVEGLGGSGGRVLFLHDGGKGQDEIV